MVVRTKKWLLCCSVFEWGTRNGLECRLSVYNVLRCEVMEFCWPTFIVLPSDDHMWLTGRQTPRTIHFGRCVAVLVQLSFHARRSSRGKYLATEQ